MDLQAVNIWFAYLYILRILLVNLPFKLNIF